MLIMSALLCLGSDLISRWLLIGDPGYAGFLPYLLCFINIDDENCLQVTRVTMGGGLGRLTVCMLIMMVKYVYREMAAYR